MKLQAAVRTSPHYAMVFAQVVELESRLLEDAYSSRKEGGWLAGKMARNKSCTTFSASFGLDDQQIHRGTFLQPLCKP